jgi:hypothetical protein
MFFTPTNTWAETIDLGINITGRNRDGVFELVAADPWHCHLLHLDPCRRQQIGSRPGVARGKFRSRPCAAHRGIKLMPRGRRGGRRRQQRRRTWMGRELVVAARCTVYSLCPSPLAVSRPLSPCRESPRWEDKGGERLRENRGGSQDVPCTHTHKEKKVYKSR